MQLQPQVGLVTAIYPQKWRFSQHTLRVNMFFYVDFLATRMWIVQQNIRHLVNKCSDPNLEMFYMEFTLASQIHAAASNWITGSPKTRCNAACFQSGWNIQHGDKTSIYPMSSNLAPEHPPFSSLSFFPGKRVPSLPCGKWLEGV